MGGNWWTGLTDKENESNWKWPHSQKMAIYTSWKSGQPNGAINSSEDYVYMSQGNDYNWIDVTDNSKYYPLCQFIPY